MQNTCLEPGILKILRFFLIVQLILLLADVTAHAAHGFLNGKPWLILLAGAASLVLLFWYSSSTWLQTRLGRLYLPLVLTLLPVYTLLMQDIFLDIHLSAAKGSGEESAMTLFFLLFVPLVLVSWQYSFKAVIAYSLFTFIFEVVLMIFWRADFHATAGTYVRLFLIRTIAFIITGYIIVRIMRQFRQQRAALLESNKKLTLYSSTLEQLAVSRERNRMARELHDTLAHTLSAIAVQLEGARSLWQAAPDKSYAMLEQSLKVTRNGSIETRKAIQSLRASPLEDLGINLAIRELAEACAARAGFILHVEIHHPLDNLPQYIEQCLYRIVQESLENIVKHAGAHNVSLEIKQQNGRLSLLICDDGSGFSPEFVKKTDRFGLRGMCERADMAGGKVEISSIAGQGTSIRFDIEVA